MVNPGQTKTYTYSSNSRVTEDISSMNQIEIVLMNGPKGADSNWQDYNGGSGGFLSGVKSSVAKYDKLDIYLGEKGDNGNLSGGEGGSDGGDGGTYSTENVIAGSGGGSTEVIARNTTTSPELTQIIAIADGGGGAADEKFTNGFKIECGGGGGGRGGAGGRGRGDATRLGQSAEGNGDGGTGGSIDSRLTPAGEDGGTRLGKSYMVTGNITKGGATTDNGKVEIKYSEYLAQNSILTE